MEESIVHLAYLIIALSLISIYHKEIRYKGTLDRIDVLGKTIDRIEAKIEQNIMEID